MAFSKVLLKAEIIRSVPERWKAQYTNTYSPVEVWHDESRRQTYIDLLNCRDRGLPLEGLIHSSWFELRCDSCGRDSEAVVCYDVNAEEYTEHFCVSCLQAQIERIKAVLP